MASESSVTDQSIDEHEEEKNVGDVSKYVDGEEIIFQPKEAAVKEEENNSKEDGLTGMASTASISEEVLEPADASVADVTTKDEQHDKVGEVENSLQESEVSYSSEPAVDINEGNLQSQADDAHETASESQEKSSDFVETSTSQVSIISDSKAEDLKDTEIKPTSENERKPDEASLFSTGVDISEDGNVKAETPEAANSESSKGKLEIKMIESEDLKNEIQGSVPAEIPTVVAPDVSDVPEKNDIYLGNPTSIEVPVKDIEVESGSPEEKKSKESTETKESNSNLSTIDAGDEDVGSSSYEVKPSEAAEVVEKKDDGLEEETIQTSAKIQEDLEAKTKSAQTEPNENVSEGVEIKNDDEIVEGGIETSTVPDDISSLAKVSSEVVEASEPGVVVEEEETFLESDNIDTVPKVAEVLFEGGNVFEGDKLVDKDKVVNAEAVERDFVDTITDTTEAEVSSDQVKSPTTSEIVNEALEVTSKELNNAPEASEIFSEGDKILAVDEKSESLKDEAATSVEASTNITAAEEPLVQVVEEKKEKSESLNGEAATSVEAPINTIAVEEQLDQVIEEKNEIGENLKGEAATLVGAPTDTTAAEEPLDLVVEEKNEKSESLNDEVASSVEAPKDTTAAEEALDQVIEEKIEKSESLKGEAATSVEAPTDTTAAEETLEEVMEEKNEKSKSLKGEAATLVETPTDTTAAEEPLDQVVQEKNEKSKSLKGDAATSVEAPKDTTITEEQLDQVIEMKNEKSESLKSEAATAVEAPTDTTAAEEPLDQVVEEKNEKSESLKGEASTLVEAQTDTTVAEEPLDQVIEEKNEKSESLKGEFVTSVEAPTDTTAVEEPLEQVIEEKNEKSESLKNKTAISVEVPTDTTAAKEPLDQVVEEKNEKSESLKGEVATSVEAPTDTTATEEPLDQVVEEKNEKSERLKGEAATSVEAPKDTTAAEEPLDQVVDEKNEKSESLKGEVATSVEAPADDTAAEESLDQVVEEKNEKSASLKGEPATSVDVLTDTTTAEEQLDQVIKEKNEKSESLKGEAATSVEAPTDATTTEELLDQVVKEKNEKSESLKGEAATLVEALTVTPAAEEPLDQGIEEMNEKSERLKGEAASLVEAPTDTTSAEEPLDQVVEEKNESLGTDTQVFSEDKLVVKEKYLSDEAKEINFKSQADGAHESPSVAQSDFAEKSTSQEPAFSESKTEDLKNTEIKPASENDSKPEDAPLVSTDVGISKDGNVEAETQEAASRGFLKDKVDIESIKSEDLKDEIQLVPAETPTVAVPDASEAPEKKDFDSSYLTSIEVPVKNLEVESGSPEEHKSNECTETKEPSSNVSATNAGGEVVGPSSDDTKPSGVVDVETIQTPVEILEDLEAKPDLAQTQSDEISSGVVVKKDDEIVECSIEISTVSDGIPPLAKVSYEDEKASEPGGDNIDTVLKVADAPFEEGNVLEGGKLVDKEKVVNAEAVERDMDDTITDPEESEVSSVQVKAPETTEIVNEALEVSSKELNIAPEASEVPYDSNKLSVGDEKSESLKGEAATSVEAPKDITTAEEPLDQVVQEKKRESSICETQVPSEDKLVDREDNVNEEAEEINLQSQADGADKTPSVVQCDSAETFTSQEPVFSESKNEDLKDIEIKSTSDEERKQEEALVSTGMDVSEDGNVVAETQEAYNPESSKDKVDIKLNKSEDSKGEIQVLVPDETHTVVLSDASETPQKNVDSSTLSSKEAPVEDPEVESGTPEEQKSKESTETKESSSDASTIDAGGEVVGSSSYEIRPSGVAEAIEKKNDGLEVDLEAKPELAHPQSDEIVKGGMKTSDVPDAVPPLAKASSEEEKASEPGVVVEEEEETSLKGDNIDIVPKVAEVSLEGSNVLKGDKLIDQDKVVNAEAVVERDLIDNFTDPTKAEVSSEEVIAPTTIEIVNEAQEVTSQELNIAPEASEVSTEVGKVSVGDEDKSESLIVGESTSAEATKDITAVKESLDPLFEEKKSESSVSDMAAPTEVKLLDHEKNVDVKDEERDLINTSTGAIAAEVSSEQVNAPEIVEEERDKQFLEKTSKELSIPTEASEVPSEDDQLSAGEEKSESLIGDAATSVEAPKGITTAEMSLDQVIEKKSESSITETKALPEDILVDKEKNLNEDAEEKDLIDMSAVPTAAEVSPDQVKASETAEIVKEDSNTQASEVTSKELNITPEASDVPSDGNEVSASDEEKRESLKGEDATLVEAPKDIKIAEEPLDQVIKQKSESSKTEMEAQAKDKLVDKEKDVNAEVEMTNLLDTSTDPTAAEVFSDQVKASETAEIIKEESNKQASEVTSKELNIVPEASQVPSEGDKVSSGKEEKSESFKGEDATSLKAPEDITALEKSIDQLIEENKSESSKNETEAPIETTRDLDTSMLFPKAVKDIIASEAVQEKQDEASNYLRPAETKASDSVDKEEVKVEGVLQNTIEKPEEEELGAAKAESEKSKDQGPIVSSDSGDAKPTKEVSKRESNIFSKVKRSIVKAKKAILGKSSGPKTSSEAKD